MQRLGGLDAAFLYFETPTMHMHVGGLMLVDPSTMPEPYSFGAMRDYIDSRMALVPAFRRKLATVPFNLARPYWVEDPDFDLDYHLRRIAVPAPAGDRETAEIVGDILSRPMDRSRAALGDVDRRGPRRRSDRHRQQGAPQLHRRHHRRQHDGRAVRPRARCAAAAAAVPDTWEPERAAR